MHEIDLFIRMLNEELESKTNPEIKNILRDINWSDSDRIGFCVMAIYKFILKDNLKVASVETDGIVYKIIFEQPEQILFPGKKSDKLYVLLMPQEW